MIHRTWQRSPQILSSGVDDIAASSSPSTTHLKDQRTMSHIALSLRYYDGDQAKSAQPATLRKLGEHRRGSRRHPRTGVAPHQHLMSALSASSASCENAVAVYTWYDTTALIAFGRNTICARSISWRCQLPTHTFQAVDHVTVNDT
jgi:hypothetical protein